MYILFSYYKYVGVGIYIYLKNKVRYTNVDRIYFFSLNCFWWTSGPFLYLFSSATPQRTAYSEVPFQMAAHPRIGSPL
jgi:hypothetical protein